MVAIAIRHRKTSVPTRELLLAVALAACSSNPCPVRLAPIDTATFTDVDTNALLDGIHDFVPDDPAATHVLQPRLSRYQLGDDDEAPMDMKVAMRVEGAARPIEIKAGVSAKASTKLSERSYGVGRKLGRRLREALSKDGEVCGQR